MPLMTWKQRAAARAAGVPLCRHCNERRGCRPRGLCPRCYDDRSVRGLYPAYSDRSAYRHEPPEPPEVKQSRREGDPEWRCFWCGLWRCRGPLRKCADCEAEYLRLAEGMPAPGEGE